ncbi:MAG TPA: gfo/Idh/MocA family oxidoreductase [Lentisphaeria bacterium]|nr:MAG: oxidoreductase [Lentisphaerae bacterium GWF2_50_93]HCE43222.1 gfo/Idh/MocA family oxidoreductase [Lentisphaeria bacterium]
MTNLALVGCAHIHTPGFIKRIKARSDVKVISVWDHDTVRAQKNAAELEAAVVSDVNSIWSDPKIGAVVICSETNRHEPLVIAAAAAKKPMFVEKPLGMGSADSKRMLTAIEKAGILFQTGYFMRGNPVNQFLRQAVQQGWLGKVTRARYSNCHKGSLAGWFDTDWRWMADPSIAGCGAYGDLGTHALDILMWMFGDVARATASIQVVTHRYGECDESGEGLIEFTNGARATMAAGWVDIADPVKLQISGTEGHAYVINDQLFFQSSQVPGADGKQPWTQLPAAWPHAFDLFLDAVSGKPNVPLSTVREVAARSAVMEALYKGAATRQWVEPEKM